MATWITKESGYDDNQHDDLIMVEAETAQFTATTPYTAANTDEVEFTVRDASSNIVLALSLSANPTQIDAATDNQVTITILPADTDGAVKGLHTYTVTVTDGSTPAEATAVKAGAFNLVPSATSSSSGGSLTTFEDQQLIAWAASGAWKAMSGITYDTTFTNVITAATVTWPDNSSGALSQTLDATFGTITAWSVTHVDRGKTVAQPAKTLDGSGRVTTQPAITVT